MTTKPDLVTEKVNDYGRNDRRLKIQFHYGRFIDENASQILMGENAPLLSYWLHTKGIKKLRLKMLTQPNQFL